MQLLQYLRRQLPQPLILAALQMGLQFTLCNSPLSTPYYKTHLLDAHFAHEPLAIRVKLRCCGEVAIGLDAAVEELAYEADDADCRAD